LERYYNEKVHSMFVACTHPDNGPEPFVDEVPVLSTEANLTFAYQRQKASLIQASRDAAVAAGVPASPSTEFHDVCLVRALQCLGFPVPMLRSGPFKVLEHGNVMLAPFGKSLNHIPWESIQWDDDISHGQYVLWKKGHFIGVEVSSEVTVHDGSTTTSHNDANILLEQHLCVLYKIVDAHEKSSAGLDLWGSAGPDLWGGHRGEPKSKSKSAPGSGRIRGGGSAEESENVTGDDNESREQVASAAAAGPAANESQAMDIASSHERSPVARPKSMPPTPGASPAQKKTAMRARIKMEGETERKERKKRRMAGRKKVATRSRRKRRKKRPRRSTSRTWRKKISMMRTTCAACSSEKNKRHEYHPRKPEPSL
jgi:hypothetical protein